MLMTPQEIAKKQRSQSVSWDRQARWMKVKGILVKNIRRLISKGGTASFTVECYMVFINPQKDLIRFKIEGVGPDQGGFKEFSLRGSCSTRFEMIKEFVKHETDEIYKEFWEKVPAKVKESIANFQIPSRLEGYRNCLHQKRDGSTMFAD